jgi:hypothetical protein
MIDQQNPENLQVGVLAAALVIREQKALMDELVEALWGMVTSYHAVEYMHDFMKQSSDKARAAIKKAGGKP